MPGGGACTTFKVPASNRVVDERWATHCQKIHLKNLLNVKAEVEAGESSSSAKRYVARQANRARQLHSQKRALAERERQRKIKLENQVLLRKLIDIDRTSEQRRAEKASKRKQRLLAARRKFKSAKAAGSLVNQQVALDFAEQASMSTTMHRAHANKVVTRVTRMRREQKRIESENLRLMKRIISARPTISARELQREAKRHEKLVQNLSDYTQHKVLDMSHLTLQAVQPKPAASDTGHAPRYRPRPPSEPQPRIHRVLARDAESSSQSKELAPRSHRKIWVPGDCDTESMFGSMKLRQLIIQEDEDDSPVARVPSNQDDTPVSSPAPDTPGQVDSPFVGGFKIGDDDALKTLHAESENHPTGSPFCAAEPRHINQAADEVQEGQADKVGEATFDHDEEVNSASAERTLEIDGPRGGVETSSEIVEVYDAERKADEIDASPVAQEVTSIADGETTAASKNLEDTGEAAQGLEVPTAERDGPSECVSGTASIPASSAEAEKADSVAEAIQSDAGNLEAEDAAALHGSESATCSAGDDEDEGFVATAALEEAGAKSEIEAVEPGTRGHDELTTGQSDARVEEENSAPTAENEKASNSGDNEDSHPAEEDTDDAKAQDGGKTQAVEDIESQVEEEGKFRSEEDTALKTEEERQSEAKEERQPEAGGDGDTKANDGSQPEADENREFEAKEDSNPKAEENSEFKAEEDSDLNAQNSISTETGEGDKHHIGAAEEDLEADAREKKRQEEEKEEAARKERRRKRKKEKMRQLKLQQQQQEQQQEHHRHHHQHQQQHRHQGRHQQAQSPRGHANHGQVARPPQHQVRHQPQPHDHRQHRQPHQDRYTQQQPGQHQRQLPHRTLRHAFPK